MKKNNYLQKILALPCGVALFSAIALPAATAAEPFPSRPIRLLSPFAPGGGNDIISRTLGAALSKNLGQSIVVDNRPGGNTIIAMELLARATPDGYTLLTTSSSQATNATLYSKLPYDSIRDFTPVSAIGVSPLVLAANPTLPIKSVADLIGAARAKPGALMYPSAGTGNSTHLGGEILRSLAIDAADPRAAAERKGVESVAVISYSDQRAGAWSQIQMLCSQAGVDCLRANDPETLKMLLAELGHRLLPHAVISNVRHRN